MLAACTHPRFKTNWITDLTELEYNKSRFVVDPTSPVCETNSSCVDDYLDFTARYQSKPDELEYFLRDPEVSIEMLDRYPQIKDLFMRFNTAIPSSAPVERLFSQAALVLTVKRSRLRDGLLVILILMKIALKLNLT
jgi:hypothetical protein